MVAKTAVGHGRELLSQSSTREGSGERIARILGVNPQLPTRACILIPTYDNGRTLADVVERARETGLDVLVVDDGSGDRTSEILASIAGIVVHRHPRNLGKGAALKSGFRLADELGYTHAITL